MSTDNASKIRACLTAYLSRTQEAILALREEKFRLFEDWMRRRTIAYHNFRAIDAKARLLGYDGSSDPEIIEIFPLIRNCDAELSGLIAAAKEEANEQLRKIESGKKRIARYKSRSGERKNLVQTV